MNPRDLQNIAESQGLTDQAYHGTSYTIAHSVLIDGWKPSTGPDQMLGDGVYYFEGSRSQALGWARLRHPKENRSVIRSTVKYGRCLHLVDSQAQEMVVYVAQHLESRGVRDVTDAVAINALAKIGKIDTVRAPRRRNNVAPFRGGPLDVGLEILLCVRTVENILESDIVLSEIAT